MWRDEIISQKYNRLVIFLTGGGGRIKRKKMYKSQKSIPT